jgi:glycosyltransferase involved in cell wall biosynthesis
MKILHVLRAPVGGLFRHVVDLAHGQIERGHEVGIVADSCTAHVLSEQTLTALAPKLALGLSRFRIWRQPGPADMGAVWHVARRIHASGAEIVHGHGAKGGALARLAPARHALVRAYTPHGGSLHDAVGGRICILMERALKRRGQLYLFESAYSHDVYRRKIGRPAGSVRIVHNGIRQDECEAVALAAEASDLVYLGEMRALKGVDVLIEALAHLRDGGRRVTATLIGDGPDAARFRSHADALGLDELLTFRKPMPTRKALALGRIVAVPSRAESLPYVVLEAAAAGKPLLATAVGGIPEVFGPLAERLVRPDDARALAAAIVDAVDRPDVTADAAHALRARVQTAFSVDVMVDGVVSAYHHARALPKGQANEEAHAADAAIERQLTMR